MYIRSGLENGITCHGTQYIYMEQPDIHTAGRNMSKHHLTWIHRNAHPTFGTFYCVLMFMYRMRRKSGRTHKAVWHFKYYLYSTTIVLQQRYYIVITAIQYIKVRQPLLIPVVWCHKISIICNCVILTFISRERVKKKKKTTLHDGANIIFFIK